MAKHNKVSVILTSYNHAKYLREAIDSVLAQTYSGFDLIIWDDGSTDNSWQIIQSYTDSRIRAFKNETEVHGSPIRSLLSKVETGEYVAIHHSDDVWDPEKLEKQVDFMESNPHIGAVFTWAQAIDEEGQLLHDRDHFYYNIFEQPNRTRHEWLNHFFYHGNILCHPSVLIRKQCYMDVGLYRYGMAQIADLDMWVRLCLKHEIFVLPERLVRFRIREKEQNSSAIRPDVQIRVQFEFMQVYSNYLSITDRDEFLKIFPQSSVFFEKEEFDIRFALAMTALSSPYHFGRLFGLQLLFDMINDPASAEKIERIYGFRNPDLVELTAKYDIFSVISFPEVQRQLNERDAQVQAQAMQITHQTNQLAERTNRLAERTNQLAEMNGQIRTLNNQLHEITISKAWQVAMLLRRIRVSLFPPGSWRTRVAGKIISFMLFPVMMRRANKANRELALIQASGLFDPGWYLEHYPDVINSRMDPARHYLLFGGFEGRDPGPNFSSSWYLDQYADVKTAGINPLVHYMQYGKSEMRAASPQIHNTSEEFVKESSLDSDVNQLTVFTICSRNFTAYAKTLFESVSQYHPSAQMFLFLCDDLDTDYNTEGFPFKVIPLTELAIPAIEEMSQRYNITEFNTAIKPYAFSYLFKKLGKNNVIYLDPDILIVSPLQEVVDAFSQGSECVLTPHILEPAENVEMSDIRMLQFGIYNLGFLALRNTMDVLRIVEWWERQLVTGCVINLAQGLFVDQKWADLFPAFLLRTSILHHPGYNVAYWNIPQRTIKLINDRWYSNQQPLRFVHFSGNRLDDPYFFSRHSGTVTLENIRDLKILLKLYHKRLYANGHAAYSKIPYSFSWNGVSGINLHTPKPSEPPLSNTNSANPPNMGTPGANSLFNRHRSNRPFGKLLGYWDLLRTASNYSGGWTTLASKVVRAVREGGLHTVRQRAQFVNNQMQVLRNIELIKPDKVLSHAPVMEWASKVLLIDSSTPMPDKDAGSLSTYNILKIYVDLGYDVTFIPSDLAYLGEYTQNIQELGVRCLTINEIRSVKDHLQGEGTTYDFIILCRAPIAAHYIADAKKFAPKAKIIFDTIDLHYLRTRRAAEIDGSQELIEAAKREKALEFDIIRKCDVTIVLSSVEKLILTDELPDADIRLIPLIFVENVYDFPPFEERKDFLFIGGFPHLPNIDAVIYFSEEILPLILKRLPDIKFHIIGNNPPPKVLELGNREEIIVHGFVKDLTPLFRTSKLSIAPLRYGAGIKGKIATSLANGVPVIATNLAVEGMEIEPGEHVLVADNPQQFADVFIEIYQSKDLWTRLSQNGRDRALQEYSSITGHRRIASLMQEINPEHKRLDLYTLRSFKEYDILKQTISTDLSERRNIELSIIQHGQNSFLIDGFCVICGRKSSFITSFMYSYETTEGGQPIPNWREHLSCVTCGFTNRLRASMQFFYQRVQPHLDADIYITEQATPMFKWLKQNHSKLIGSEYLGDTVPLGSQKNGLRNEDMTALTFADESFDYILSFDVMEHVADDIAALREVYRCLKPGGTFLFTAPFAKSETQKLVRAQILPDGSIEHLMTPEYHGNPIDHENGSLCFRYFAWDLLEDMRKVGFKDPIVLNYWSRDFAYLGREQFIFMASKGRDGSTRS